MRSGPGRSLYPPNTVSTACCTYGQLGGAGQDFGYSGWISNALIPYTKNQQIYQCPSGQATAFADPWNGGIKGSSTNSADSGPNFISYAFNYVSDNGVKEAAFTDVSNAIVVGDSGTAWWDCGYESGCGWRTRDWANHLTKNTKYTEYHTGKNNFLFEDGHVKSYGWDQVTWGQLANMNAAGCTDSAGVVVYGKPVSYIVPGNGNCGYFY